MKKRISRGVIILLTLILSVLTLSSCNSLVAIGSGSKDAARAKELLNAADEHYADGCKAVMTGEVELEMNSVNQKTKYGVESKVFVRHNENGMEMTVQDSTQVGSQILENVLSYDGHTVYVKDTASGFSGYGECDAGQFEEIYSLFVANDVEASKDQIVDSFSSVKVSETDGRVSIVMSGIRNKKYNPCYIQAYATLSMTGRAVEVERSRYEFVISADTNELIQSSVQITASSADYSYTMAATTVYENVNAESEIVIIPSGLDKQCEDIATLYKAHKDLKGIAALERAEIEMESFVRFEKGGKVSSVSNFFTGSLYNGAAKDITEKGANGEIIRKANSGYDVHIWEINYSSDGGSKITQSLEAEYDGYRFYANQDGMIGSRDNVSVPEAFGLITTALADVKIEPVYYESLTESETGDGRVVVITFKLNDEELYTLGLGGVSLGNDTVKKTLTLKYLPDGRLSLVSCNINYTDPAGNKALLGYNLLLIYSAN